MNSKALMDVKSTPTKTKPPPTVAGRASGSTSMARLTLVAAFWMHNVVHPGLLTLLFIIA